MKIRSITVNMGSNGQKMDEISSFVDDARSAYPVDVQTARASVTPRNGMYSNFDEAMGDARGLDEWALSSKLDYVGGFGLGIYPDERDLTFLNWVPGILDGTERLFSNCQLAHDGRISLMGIRQASRLVKILSKIDEGFLNLRFAGLYNCAPDNPFFPASYSSGDKTNFTMSIEGADIAQSAFINADSLSDAKNKFLALMRDAYCVLLSNSLELEEKHGMPFYGVDFTLAPTPKEEGSIAKAVEMLGIDFFGASGSLFLSSFLSDCIKSLGGNIGFSGLMYPVLEDGVIARRASEGSLTLDSLLLYSAVCGTGLDCVPLPGDVSQRALAAIMLDVAGLSTRLHKPLTTRLFPVSGKGQGEYTTYDFPYFSNARTLPVKDGKIKDWRDIEYRFSL